MLKVVAGKYTVGVRRSANMRRDFPALVKVDSRVIVIGGRMYAVSSYNLKTNTWVDTLPQLKDLAC